MKEYQSSGKRLVQWFHESRENWKEKAQSKQKRLRAAEIKIRDLENSRDKWKERAKKAEKELSQRESVLIEGKKKGAIRGN
jgi:hypothetical protein